MKGLWSPGTAHTLIPAPPDDSLRGLPAQGLLLPQLLQHPGPAGGQRVPHLLRHPVSGARGPGRGTGQGRGSERAVREKPACVRSSVRALGPGQGLPGGCGPKEVRHLRKVTSRRVWGTLQSDPHPPGRGPVCPWRTTVACPPGGLALEPQVCRVCGVRAVPPGLNVLCTKGCGGRPPGTRCLPRRSPAIHTVFLQVHDMKNHHRFRLQQALHGMPNGSCAFSLLILATSS